MNSLKRRIDIWKEHFGYISRGQGQPDLYRTIRKWEEPYTYKLLLENINITSGIMGKVQISK